MICLEDVCYKTISICYVQSWGKDPTSDVRSSPRKSTLISQLLQAMSLVTVVAVVAPFFCYAWLPQKVKKISMDQFVLVLG